ncbi:MAG: hypothetical protein BGO21_06150 [Dyadobacter sp. 50-39]|uniref:PH domain-containing protein n=1 Tax=Dyadobacter sp. 50-39 TaxID=1895756 RepID=UPI0009681444|nr:PH domain-containing protein [Dyadobacter sp. 50-39]OJV12329.1 MAG: hypothetical protein BGO21_06150 [Dyadobacter sp. 50-39]
MNFTASNDRTTKIITIALTALFVGIIAFEFFTFSDEAKIGAFVSTAILVVTYGAAYIYHPINYTLTDQDLIIHRPVSDVRYPRDTFELVERIPKENLKFTIRTFGVGGLWGYYGKFYNSVYGKMTWYLTRRDQLVLIKTTDKKTILLSPDDIDSFLTALRSAEPALG